MPDVSGYDDVLAHFDAWMVRTRWLRILWALSELLMRWALWLSARRL
jgi:hypothetical protein